MSEYRYCEFQAINRLLTAKETELLPPEDMEAVVCSRASRHGRLAGGVCKTCRRIIIQQPDHRAEQSNQWQKKDPRKSTELSPATWNR